MNDQWIFLVNPQAGGGLARKAWPEIEATLDEAGVPYEAVATRSREDAELRARELAAHPIRGVVVVGGDGAINAVANGLVQATQAGSGYLPLGIIPLGTHNDLASMLNLPIRQPVEATRRLLAGEPYRMDVGVIRTAGQFRNEWFFINGLTIGPNEGMARAMERSGGRATLLRDAIQLPLALRGYSYPELQLEFHGLARTLPVTLLAVGNGARQFGGLELTPDASLDDGQLDLCVVRPISTMAMPTFLRQAMEGSHLAQAAVTVEQTERLLVSSQLPFSFFMDGTLFRTKPTKLEIGLLPAALSVLV